MNGLTAFIDGSNIYGSDDETSIGLGTVRTIKVRRGGGKTKSFPGAKLKTQLSIGHEALPSRSKCGFAFKENSTSPKTTSLVEM